MHGRGPRPGPFTSFPNLTTEPLGPSLGDACRRRPRKRPAARPQGWALDFLLAPLLLARPAQTPRRQIFGGRREVPPFNAPQEAQVPAEDPASPGAPSLPPAHGPGAPPQAPPAGSRAPAARSHSGGQTLLWLWGQGCRNALDRTTAASRNHPWKRGRQRRGVWQGEGVRGTSHANGTGWQTVARVGDFRRDLDEIPLVSEDNSLTNPVGFSGILALVSFHLGGFCAPARPAGRTRARLSFVPPISPRLPGQSGTTPARSLGRLLRAALRPPPPRARGAWHECDPQEGDSTSWLAPKAALTHGGGRGVTEPARALRPQAGRLGAGRDRQIQNKDSLVAPLFV